MEKVWAINDAGACVEVWSAYLYLCFSHSRKKCYRIDCTELYTMLQSQKGEFVLGDLTFTPMTETDGEATLSILNEKTVSDKDLLVVNRNELKEALYYWIG